MKKRKTIMVTEEMEYMINKIMQEDMRTYQNAFELLIYHGYNWYEKTKEDEKQLEIW